MAWSCVLIPELDRIERVQAAGFVLGEQGGVLIVAIGFVDDVYLVDPGREGVREVLWDVGERDDGVLQVKDPSGDSVELTRPGWQGDALDKCARGEFVLLRSGSGDEVYIREAGPVRGTLCVRDYPYHAPVGGFSPDCAFAFLLGAPELLVYRFEEEPDKSPRGATKRRPG